MARTNDNKGDVYAESGLCGVCPRADATRADLFALYMRLQTQQLEVDSCYDAAEHTYRVGWNNSVGNTLRELAPLLLPVPTYSCTFPSAVEIGPDELRDAVVEFPLALRSAHEDRESR